MASTYTNDLRLELIATGEAAATWGDKTNVNLTNIAAAFGYATQDGFAANADSTTTVADGAADPARAMYFKVTSSATLTATRTLTIAPNTISRVMWIENATTGGQSIQISQGTGANVTIATGKTAVVYLDGAGSGAAVVDAMAGVSSGASDTLAEILASGNATGGTDIAVGTGDDITFADSSKAIFGSGSDLQIYHDASDSIILDNGTGNLKIQADDLVLKNADGSKEYLKGTNGGSVRIRYNNTTVLETTATGIDVTGTVVSDGLTVEADSGGGGGSTTPVVAVISDADGGSSWVSGTIFAATDYKSGDGSGAGSGVRVRTGIAQEASSGSTSSYIVQTAPTTAGTMLDRLKISSGGDISFYEDTGTTAKLFWDASAESLGIGTSSPAQPLEILKTSSAAVVPMIQLRNGSSSAGSGTAIKFMHSTASNATSGTCELESIRYSGNLGALTFKTSNNGGTVTERMRVNDTGVGVGTDSPTRALSVFGDTAGVISITSNSTDGISSLAFGDTADDNAGRVNYLNASDDMLFYTATAERMRISSGNLLVGKTSTTFSVVGVENRADGRITSTRSGNTNLLLNRLSSDGDIVQFYKDGTQVGSIGVASSRLYIGTDDTGLRFTNDEITPFNPNASADRDGTVDLGGSSTRFKDLYLSGSITSGANGGLIKEIGGDTSIVQGAIGLRINDFASALSPTTGTANNDGNVDLGISNVRFKDLHLSGNATHGTTPSSSAAGVFTEAVGRTTYSSGSGTGGFSNLKFINGNGTVGTVTTSGSATAYNTSSDYRLKENVVAMSGATERLKQLKPSRFNFIADADTTVDGFLAHEVQDIVPEAISGTKDAVDEDGNPEYQGIDQSKLVPLLVATIQELEARIAALES